MGLTTGWQTSYPVGSLGPAGAVLDPCPPWITTQQAAELWGTVVALDQAQRCGAHQLVLVGDNAGALAHLLWGRASPVRPHQQRTLRRVAHRLRWMGITVTVEWVPSGLKPADAISRAADGRGARAAVLEAAAKEVLWDSSAWWVPSGDVLGRDKSVRPWTGPVAG